MTSNMNRNRIFSCTGKVTSASMTVGQLTTINTVWTVPKIINILEQLYMRELRPEKPTDASEKSTYPRLQVKMQLLGRNNDIIEIYFLSPITVFLKSTLTLCSHEERPVAIKDYHTLRGNKWEYLATLQKRDITSKDSRYKFIHSDGSLMLIFEFVIRKYKKVDRSIVPEKPQLSRDFENLLYNGIFSDVTMKSAEGNEYKVHKAVLASRSVVLKAHFEHNTIECQTNIVQSPLEAEVLVEVLFFIYSDKAPRVDEIPERLLVAADHYQLSRLKSLCEEALGKKLTVENALETFQLAELHSARILKQLTLEFIKDGQKKVITRTEGWANVKSVELIKTICEHMVADD